MGLAHRHIISSLPNRDRDGPHGLPPSHTTGHTDHVSGGSADEIEVVYSPRPKRLLPLRQWPVHPRRRTHGPTPRRVPSRHSTAGDDSSLPFRPSARTSVHTMPPADSCLPVRDDLSSLSPTGQQAGLPRSAVIPSVHRRPIYKAPSDCGWRALLSRASSPRRYHTSYQVRVPRPAHSLHASFRPHLAVTPLRFTCLSAPRTPGQGTCTPKHVSMHGTHAIELSGAVLCAASAPASGEPAGQPRHQMT